MNKSVVNQVVYGKRLDMIEEVAAFDPCSIGVPAKECRYLVKPMGQREWDTTWFATKTEAKAEAKAIAAEYPGSVFRNIS